MKKNFTDLEIWKEGYSLLMDIYTASENFPDFEKYSLTSQSVRSANSVIANIAEAHGRYYYKDKVKSLYISRAEAAETQSHLLVAKGLKYLKEDQFEHLYKQYEILKMKINGYIRFILNSAHQISNHQ